MKIICTEAEKKVFIDCVNHTWYCPFFYNEKGNCVNCADEDRDNDCTKCCESNIIWEIEEDKE